MSVPPIEKGPLQPPHIPSGQEIFDLVMGHLEPELTSQKIEETKEKYKDESPEEHQARMKRYNIAFERYDEAYGGYIETLDSQVERYRRESFQILESADRKREEESFDQTFATAA